MKALFKSTTIATTLFFSLCVSVLAQSDFATVHDRARSEYLKSPVDDAEIKALLESLKDDGTWPGIDYEDVSRTGFEHRFHSSNMVQLAQAYSTKTSDFYRKKRVMNAIELSLSNWVNNDYYCDNSVQTGRSLIEFLPASGAYTWIP